MDTPNSLPEVPLETQPTEGNGIPLTPVAEELVGKSLPLREPSSDPHESTGASDEDPQATITRLQREIEEQRADTQKVVALAIRQAARIKELEDAHKRLAYAATHDELTRLLNRQALKGDERSGIEGIMASFKPGDTVMLLDVNGFKRINDRFGHPVGDIELQEIASRLTRLLRVDDVAFRLGGDEFLVVLRENETSEEDDEHDRRAKHQLDVNKFLERLELEGQSDLEGGEHSEFLRRIGFGMAVGVATIDNRGFWMAYKDADQLMYDHKNRIQASIKKHFPDSELPREDEQAERS